MTARFTLGRQFGERAGCRQVELGEKRVRGSFLRAPAEQRADEAVGIAEGQHGISVVVTSSLARLLQ